MSAVASQKPLSTHGFLELPENGHDRMLIRGELWDKPTTYRNPFHSAVMMQLGYLLQRWLRNCPGVLLKIPGGEAGFRLQSDPSSNVGIDVAVAPKDQPEYSYKNRVIREGPPLLAVEILSPSDRRPEIDAKVDEYLAVGAPLVWIVDPHFRTVTIHRPGRPPRMMTEQDDLSGEDVLPDFPVQVRQVFETM
jgi:hypothetical protein